MTPSILKKSGNNSKNIDTSKWPISYQSGINDSAINDFAYLFPPVTD